MTPWPHQAFAVREVQSAILSGERRIVVASPTGGGKTWVAAELIRQWLDNDHKVALYTNRKLLVEQTSRVLKEAGIGHGVRSAGHDDERGYYLQVCSIQTEDARVFKSSRWQLHDAERVLIDEAHLNRSGVARKILKCHHAEGASYVGLTATPLDLGDLYDHLIVAGTNSELRSCGALVRCDHYAPSEPDLKHIGKVVVGEDLSEAQNRKAMLVPGIFGFVYGHWRRLNPDGKPTILFGPDVAGSLWFAEQFWSKGVSAAHVDGQQVWVNGRTYRRTHCEDDPARDILEASRDGRLSVICNRFVLREGIDAPWLSHGIFATVIGSLQSYLQSGGRLLRSNPSLVSVVLQDHGGNWHRHGSLNADRHWKLGDSGRILSGERQDVLRNPKPGDPKQPAVCPRCFRVLMGLSCPCGFEIDVRKKSRMVHQEDGKLLEVMGDVYKPRRESRKSDAARIWERVYYRCKAKGKTFRQAFALFAKENNWCWPARTMPLMPREEIDTFQRVCDVPPERLVPKERN